MREAEGRGLDPGGAILDSQAVKTIGVGGSERGYDGAKRLVGRKRHILVDTNGLVLGALIHAANLHDRDGGQRLLAEELRGELPGLDVVWADAVYTRRFREERGRRAEVPCPRRAAVALRASEARRDRAASGFCRGGGW